MTAVQRPDPHREWRWSPDQAPTTEKLIDAAIAAIRDGEMPNTWLVWAVTGITYAQLVRYFPTEADLMAEVRDRVARQVIVEAAVDPATKELRALSPWRIACALVDFAWADPLLWRALADKGLVDSALERVAVVAGLQLTFPRLTVHVDSGYRRSALAAVIRAVIDHTLALDPPDRPAKYDVVEILDGFLAGVMRATAAS